MQIAGSNTDRQERQKAVVAAATAAEIGNFEMRNKNSVKGPLKSTVQAGSAEGVLCQETKRSTFKVSELKQQLCTAAW